MMARNGRAVSARSGVSDLAAVATSYAAIREAGLVQIVSRRATSAGVAALAGALTGALAGFVLGGLVGSLVGLPPGRLLSDAADEGFDQLDLALLISSAFWIVGAVTAAWLRHRRTPGFAVRPLVAAPLLAVLGGSTTIVSSGTADWYVPLVVLGAPLVVFGTLAALAPDQANPDSE
jgi:hypothetical protein